MFGYPLLYSPSDHGRNTLAAEILKCNDSKNGHELLGGLAHVYVYGLIRVCRRPSIGFCLPFFQRPTVCNQKGDTHQLGWANPLLSVQEAAAKLEHLFKKPHLTAKGAERTGEFILQITCPSVYRFHR